MADIERVEATFDNPRLSVRGGNAGIMMAGKIISNTYQGCPRKQLLRSYGVSTPIDARARRTFAIGRAIEDCFAQENPQISCNHRQEEMPVLGEGPKPGQEVKLAIEVDGVEQITNSAGDIEPRFYELKTVQSTDKAKDYIAAGEYSFDNLVQLSYAMFAFGARLGRLIYFACFYHKFTMAGVEHKVTPETKRVYEVEIKNDRIFCDGKPTIITADSVARHIEYSAFILGTLSEKILSIPRPSCHSDKMVKKSKTEPIEHLACQWCDFRELCELAEEKDMNQEQFVKAGKEFVDGKSISV
jgi:hypothetical protein